MFSLQKPVDVIAFAASVIAFASAMITLASAVIAFAPSVITFVPSVIISMRLFELIPRLKRKSSVTFSQGITRTSATCGIFCDDTVLDQVLDVTISSILRTFGQLC